MNSLLARLLLALAYPWLAHAATTQANGVLAAVALGDIVLILLLEPLLRRRPWAFAALLASVPMLWLLSRSPYALVPLLLVPVAFVALVAWSFARTLRPGCIPLISRIVAALEARSADQLEPEIRQYTRRLTAVWAGALALLAAVNLALALVAVPRGLLATFGVMPPFAVTEAQWSWFANWLDYGLVGGLFVVEYLFRKHRFPGRYPSFPAFLRRMAALGPQFWRTLLH